MEEIGESRTGEMDGTVERTGNVEVDLDRGKRPSEREDASDRKRDPVRGFDAGPDARPVSTRRPEEEGDAFVESAALTGPR